MHLPDATSVTGPSAIFRAAANEFGSNSRSIWHAQDQADFTHAMTVHPSEALPCSMSTLLATGTFPDTISMPVRTLQFFVTYILGSLDEYADQRLHTILTSTEAKRNRLLAQYSSSFSSAAQAKEDELSMQLLDAFRLQQGIANGTTLDAQSDSQVVPPALEAEDQLPPPVRQAIQCLRSVMLTLKLASFITPITNSASNACSVICQVLMDMKYDLSLALQSFALHTEQAAAAAADLQRVPPSPSPAVATAERDICNWSQLAIGLLLPILKWAVKELGNELAPGLGVWSFVALSNLLLLEVFLHQGQPHTRSAVGQATVKAGAKLCLYKAQLHHKLHLASSQPFASSESCTTCHLLSSKLIQNSKFGMLCIMLGCFHKPRYLPFRGNSCPAQVCGDRSAAGRSAVCPPRSTCCMSVFGSADTAGPVSQSPHGSYERGHSFVKAAGP